MTTTMHPLECVNQKDALDLVLFISSETSSRLLPRRRLIRVMMLIQLWLFVQEKTAAGSFEGVLHDNVML